MNRKEFISTLSVEQIEELKIDIELEGCAWVARKHNITYHQIIGIKNDLKIKVNKYRMNSRKTKSLTKHFDNERRLKE